MLEESLQIVLLTYNRCEKLTETLKSLFAQESPVRNLDITIIDNASTDETSAVIRLYLAKFPNLKYKKNEFNIGGNANIARAFEFETEKDYLWVLCDDDEYDWSAWGEVVEAVKNKTDLIITSREFCHNKVNLGTLFKQLSFLPSIIIRRENITSNVIQNAHFNIPFLFPHLAPICEMVNNGKFKNHVLVSKSIVLPRNSDMDYTRGLDCTSEMIQNTLWITGFVNSIQLIRDAKTRKYILDNLLQRSLGFFSMISAEFKHNRLRCGNSFKNICDVFCGISIGQKFQFILALIWLDIIYFIKKFILRRKKYTGGKA